MKKTLLFTALFILAFQGYSQAAKYGVRAGVTISNLDFEKKPTLENQHRNGFYIGFLADFNLSKNISLQPEIQFSAEGAKQELIQLDYLQAPILLKLRLGNKMHLGAGPQVGLKIHKKDDGIRNMAYSAVGALEYKLNYALFIDARYTYGISNIFDEYLGVSAKNSTIQLGVGYKF
ncbi:porin family protein [Mariniflexile ostreae]|uniref:Porin family protein n=1 Tax=Mariniflexile ostreae TaxID=1520892 RepID=A0ABV5F840_9FLAO